MSICCNTRIGRIAIAVVLGGVLGAFSTTRIATAEDTPTVAATEARPIVGPAADRFSPADVAAGPSPVSRLSPPVPPDFLRSPCQTPGEGCGSRVVAPLVPPTAGPDRVLPSPPIVLD